jgi:hypothetical protein
MVVLETSFDGSVKRQVLMEVLETSFDGSVSGKA